VTVPARVSRENEFDEFMRRLVEHRNDAGASSAFHDLVGQVVEAMDDQRTSSVVRRRLLKVADDRLDLLMRFLDDPFTPDEKKARLLIKMLEVGLKVPGAALEAESAGATFRVRTGGGG